MSEQTVFEQAQRLLAELEQLSRDASQQAATTPLRYYSLSCAAETAARALADALDDGPSDADMWAAWDAEDAAEDEPEPDLSGNWMHDLVEGDDAGQEDESFDPYAGGVIFERDASDW